MKGQVDCCCGPGGFGRAVVIWARNVHSMPRKDSFILDSINYYQKQIDPQLKKEFGVKKMCSFMPTCSQYAKVAVKKRGPVIGMLLGAFRLLRCNPITGGGYDPV